jgi:tRNA dimethylallyltransferase
VESGERRALLIAGPTASGKSAFALELAGRLGGTVINADSMQVYRELSILTARPTAEEMAAVPHRLYGHVTAAEVYSVARWLSDVREAMAEEAEKGRVPILVGGTGLYLSALTRGLADVPPIACEVKAEMKALAETRSVGDLHAELTRRDPVMAARLRPTDPQRILRALEVVTSTGRSLAAFHAEPLPPALSPGSYDGFVIAPDRAWLHARIRRRFERMAEEGGLEEAARFAALNLDPSLPAMKAIGVPELSAAARGEITVEEAIERAVIATRKYAKRQETWFRNQLPDWERVRPEEAPTSTSVPSPVGRGTG